jgi:3-isopropylmalate dehydrogenase
MSKKYKIALLPGDGIGEEVCDEAVKVLKAVESRFDVEFVFNHALVGGAAWDTYKSHLPKETIEICEAADTILFGSVGGPMLTVDTPTDVREKWTNAEKNALLTLRKTFNLAINLRPCKVYSFLAQKCPLKLERIADGVDILIVRELVSGIYFGKHEISADGFSAIDEMYYNRDQIAVAIEFGIKACRLRKKILTVVDKANVLSTSTLWRQVTEEYKAMPENADITFEYLYVDNAAMQLVQRPTQFDVIVTGNMFGDILSDIGSTLPGSLGLMPTASMSPGKGKMMFEPAGGSAPDIAGMGVANPLAQILSAAWMLRYQFEMEDAAVAIETAIDTVLGKGLLTADLDRACPYKNMCADMGSAVAQEVKKPGSFVPVLDPKKKKGVLKATEKSNYLDKVKECMLSPNFCSAMTITGTGFILGVLFSKMAMK